jgi:hypothetical protein
MVDTLVRCIGPGYLYFYVGNCIHLMRHGSRLPTLTGAKKILQFQISREQSICNSVSDRLVPDSTPEITEFPKTFTFQSCFSVSMTLWAFAGVRLLQNALTNVLLDHSGFIRCQKIWPIRFVYHQKMKSLSITLRI